MGSFLFLVREGMSLQSLGLSGYKVAPRTEVCSVVLDYLGETTIRSSFYGASEGCPDDAEMLGAQGPATQVF